MSGTITNMSSVHDEEVTSPQILGFVPPVMFEALIN
jgi:hypothetical protein